MGLIGRSTNYQYNNTERYPEYTLDISNTKGLLEFAKTPKTLDLEEIKNRIEIFQKCLDVLILAKNEGKSVIFKETYTTVFGQEVIFNIESEVSAPENQDIMFVGEAINFSCRYIFGDILTDRILKAKQISDDSFDI